MLSIDTLKIKRFSERALYIVMIYLRQENSYKMLVDESSSRNRLNLFLEKTTEDCLTQRLLHHHRRLHQVQAEGPEPQSC